MCRLLAVRTPDPTVRRHVLSAFRAQAAHGRTGPEATHRRHGDGWGVAGLGLEGTHLLGRSILEATSDPEYDVAVGLAKETDPQGFVLAHVRNASVGGLAPDNCQPFVRDGWMFAHNGTIYDLAPPEGVRRDGSTDSEAFFLHLLEAYRRLGSMHEAIQETVVALSRSHRHSSLTFVLSDGLELFAFRRVGADHKHIPDLAQAFEHYTLGWGLYRGAFMVTQEPEIVDAWQSWNVIPDGYLLHVPAGGAPRISPILEPSVSQLRRVAPLVA